MPSEEKTGDSTVLVANASRIRKQYNIAEEDEWLVAASLIYLGSLTNPHPSEPFATTISKAANILEKKLHQMRGYNDPKVVRKYLQVLADHVCE